MYEAMIGVSIAVGVLYVIILFAICFKFASIAEMKGHNKSTYFWWCFWCGIFGMLVVIALPDRNMPKTNSSAAGIAQPQNRQAYTQQTNSNSDELPDL